ncbi:MAG TPA: amylo-alpha-1,6-glucosidase [Myxococcales bacterium]|nr:amylo-alpha-1,6-glucosidase [Myxococcales bacterium]
MRRVCWRRGEPGAGEKEWLVTNGLGGYASGTVAGPPTRRFHGALVAATPRGRILAVSELQDDAGEAEEFALEDGLPLWRYTRLEKRIVLPQGRNLTLVCWRAREPVTLRVCPWLQVRPHEGRVDAPARAYPVALDGRVCEIDRGSSLPILIAASKGDWRAPPPRTRTVRYRVEEERGYDCEGPLVTPCSWAVQLAAGEEATLAISTDAWEPTLDRQALRDEERARRAALVGGRSGLAAELCLAADQFLFRKPAGGPQDRSVIAGYHWFTDWGRDTMISLEGLCLVTGRHELAGRILRTFAGHVRDGLVPNLFPEGESQGLYHTADATLWFFHALDRYTRISGDGTLLRELLPLLGEIVARHLEGTRFGIGVDADDGLLRQGAPGYQLTWMDAKVGDLVVTPRRGKAVEINALFYNALRLFDEWSGGDARARAAAERLRESFNRRFFCKERGHLYDVVDGEGAEPTGAGLAGDGRRPRAGASDDPSLRPNQLLAISLPHPVLDRALWEPVLRAVRGELLTPVGLRSLGPREPAYRPRYQGDLEMRDAAYHQGTVWAWLIGPFVDAWRKTFPGDDPGPFLAGFEAHLGELGLGSIAEIFDADPPHAPRGCIAQAWSVAEVLRCLG